MAGAGVGGLGTSVGGAGGWEGTVGPPKISISIRFWLAGCPLLLGALVFVAGGGSATTGFFSPGFDSLDAIF